MRTDINGPLHEQVRANIARLSYGPQVLDLADGYTQAVEPCLDSQAEPDTETATTAWRAHTAGYLGHPDAGFIVHEAMLYLANIWAHGGIFAEHVLSPYEQIMLTEATTHMITEMENHK